MAAKKSKSAEKKVLAAAKAVNDLGVFRDAVQTDWGLKKACRLMSSKIDRAAKAVLAVPKGARACMTESALERRFPNVRSDGDGKCVRRYDLADTVSGAPELLQGELWEGGVRNDLPERLLNPDDRGLMSDAMVEYCFPRKSRRSLERLRKTMPSMFASEDVKSKF